MRDWKAYLRDRLDAHDLPPARAEEIVEELAQHLAQRYEEAAAGGATEEEALAIAVADVPSRAELTEAVRQADRRPPAAAMSPGISQRPDLLREVWQDVRYALRLLHRAPGFSAVVVCTLAIGIGANTLIFSAVNALLLRPIPVTDPGRVVRVYQASADGSSMFGSFSYPDYRDLRDAGVLQELAAFGGITVSVDRGGATERVPGEIVSGNYFDVLGVRPVRGRAFLPEEDAAPGGHPVVVIGHGLWQRWLGSDPQVPGRTITINGVPHTIVGIAPRGFHSAVLGRTADVWIPVAMQQLVRPPSRGLRRALGSADLLEARSPTWLALVGRLRPGQTMESVRPGFDAATRQLADAYPDTNRDRRVHLTRLDDGPGLRRSARPTLMLLMGAVIAVLLVACTNVANLLLARATTRRRELAVRAALGAGRRRLARQWLTESVLLAFAGGAVGLALAYWASPLLYAFDVPESVSLAPDVRVLAFTAAVALATGLGFGLLPALHARRIDVASTLKDESGTVAGGRAGRWSAAFVVVQVAVSVVLLVGAGLLVRTLQNARAVDPGFDTDRTLLADLNLDAANYGEAEGRQLFETLRERLAGLPGVEAVSMARVVALSGSARTVSVLLEGEAADSARPVRTNVVGRDYLRAMGIPLVRGRDFDDRDRPGTPAVAIVTQSMARALWPGIDPVGQRFRTGRWVEVIGVARDSVYVSVLERDPLPFFYVPLSQNYESGVTIHVRTSGDPLLLVDAARQTLRDLDSRLALARVRTLTRELDESLANERLAATMGGLFGLAALALAALGLYGVMAISAGQRTHEIGVRMALGATPGRIHRLVLGRALLLTTVGLASGLAGAFAAGRYLGTFLFGVTAYDPPAILGAIAALALAAAFAAYLPARRASRVDPLVALRAE